MDKDGTPVTDNNYSAEFKCELWRELCDRLIWVLLTEVRGNGEGLEIAPPKEFPTAMRIQVLGDYGYLHNGLFDDYLDDETVAWRNKMQKKNGYIPLQIRYGQNRYSGD